MDTLNTRSSRAVIVSIGDELVTGQTVDTNSAWLSRELAGIGVSVVRHVTVADDAAATTRAMRESADDAGWVVVTGGLGPTPDDLTRQAVADLLGETLEVRDEALAQIQERFDRMGRTMAAVNRRQAEAPPSADLIVNPNGTAPGLQWKFGGATFFALPGVPREMWAMFADSVAPVVRAGVGDGAALLVATLHTFGVGESDLAERLGGLLDRGGNPQVGTTASAGSVSVRIYARADTQAEARRMLEAKADEVIERLGKLCLGRDDATLESVVGQMLREQGQTLATAESCTGGLVAKMITDVPGSSGWFIGGFVTYSDGQKVSHLGVKPATLEQFGAVSEQVAGEMASGARFATGADWAVALTGIAGPDGGSEAKPVGLVWIGLAGPDGVRVHRVIFPGDRETVRLRSARTALNLLRRALLRED